MSKASWKAERHVYICKVPFKSIFEVSITIFNTILSYLIHDTEPKGLGTFTQCKNFGQLKRWQTADFTSGCLA